jgi:hypothetical protein
MYQMCGKTGPEERSAYGSHPSSLLTVIGLAVIFFPLETKAWTNSGEDEYDGYIEAYIDGGGRFS